MEKRRTNESQHSLQLELERQGALAVHMVAGMDRTMKTHINTDKPIWFPIETAPKNELIDIWTVGFGAEPHRVCDCYKDAICDEWRTTRPMGHLYIIPTRFVTHWMPRPQAPNNEL